MRTEYVIGDFVDFKGQTRQFIMAAVSMEIEDGYVEEKIVKKVVIGLSICNPDDEWDEELGKKIARGKAINRKTRISSLYATDKGSINSTLVRAYLQQEAEFLAHNPGKYIKRYNLDKDHYEYEQKIEKARSGLSEAEKKVISGLVASGKGSSHINDFIKVLCADMPSV